MILNERQYKITNNALNKFQEAFDGFDKKAMKKNKLLQLEYYAIKSEIEVLSAQVLEYDDLKGGKISGLRATDLESLAILLIKARIARGMTQEHLANEMGMKMQQIQRYESEKYARTSLRKVSEIANVLNLSINITLRFKGITSIRNAGRRHST